MCTTNIQIFFSEVTVGNGNLLVTLAIVIWLPTSPDVSGPASLA